MQHPYKPPADHDPNQDPLSWGDIFLIVLLVVALFFWLAALPQPGP